jgi:hypothetical protein
MSAESTGDKNSSDSFFSDPGDLSRKNKNRDEMLVQDL